MTLLDLKLKYKAETGNRWGKSIDDWHTDATELENVDEIRWLIEKYFELNEKYNDTLCKKQKITLEKTSTTTKHTPPKVEIITTSENTPKKIIIDSDLLPEWANWVAKDKDGKWYCYENEPTLAHDVWACGNYVEDELVDFLTTELTPEFNGDWKDSLFKVVRKKTFDKTSEIFKS